ncbi:MAG: hypothetical protein CFK52_05885 [Chloracidobacterium sp. CP2_5A]|nr:MAG: hypothetical protein CFK52_05885 [Chloracidobacterium sp. CP2_5A]
MSKSAASPDAWAARLAECEREAARLDAIEGYAGPHATRLAQVADELASALGFSERGRRDLRAAALLHDAGEGRLDLPFLTAPRTLTFAERCALWAHPVAGERVAYERGLPEAIGLLIRWHHENWDGSGYPDGLRGEQIPLAARILRVADTWCALTQERPYRRAYRADEALKRLRADAGFALDPAVTGLWLARAADAPADESPPSVETWTVSRLPFHQAPLLGFEVAALQDAPFQSIALPFGGDGALGWRLKLLGKQVFSNDPRQAETCLAIAAVENNGYILTATLADAWLSAARDAAENPDYPFNPALRRWFPPTQARWLAGFRQAVVQESNRIVQALGMSLGLCLGDYWLAFDPSSADLRQTLEGAAIQALARVNRAVDNQQLNQATCLPAQTFAVQTAADLAYVRLPPFAPYDHLAHHRDGWRERWVSDLPQALTRLTQAHAGSFGGQLASRREYRAALRALLRRLPHFPQWAIGFSHEDAPPDDLLLEISGFRPIVKVLTKPARECGALYNQSIAFCQATPESYRGR